MSTAEASANTNDQVRAEIDSLVDEQFARIQPRLAHYLADPRRQFTSREGAILTLDSTAGVGQSIQNDEATCAFITVMPTNPESRGEAARRLLAGVVTRFGIQEPFMQLFEAVESGKIVLSGANIDMSIRREEHPMLWNAHAPGDPWVWGDPGIDYNIVGLRRHINAALHIDVVDPSTDTTVSQIEVSAKAATRFDYEETLFTSRLLLGELSCNGVEIPKQSEAVRSTSSMGDVSILARTFRATKDLRPRVTPVKAVQKWMDLCATLESGKFDEARELKN